MGKKKKKKKKEILLMRSGEPFFDLLEDLVVDAVSILANLDEYPDIQTIDDLFVVMNIDESDRTDFLYSEIVKCILEYEDEEEEEEEVPESITSALIHTASLNTHPNALYEEILTKGLFVKGRKGETYRRVVKLGFLKEKYYMPGKSEGNLILPFLGDVVDDVNKVDFEGIEPYIMTVKTLRNLEDLNWISRHLIPRQDTEPFICGKTVYSMLLDSIVVHGDLSSFNTAYQPVQRRMLL